MTDRRKTLDELLADFEPERQTEIAKAFTPEAIERRRAKEQAAKQREIERGLRDAHGDWIEQPETADDEDDEDD